MTASGLNPARCLAGLAEGFLDKANLFAQAAISATEVL